VCGPSGLIRGTFEAASLLGWPAHRVHFEHFQREHSQGGRPVRVRLQRSGTAIDVAPEKSILDALEVAGVTVNAGCRNGSCGTCATRVLAGLPDHRDAALTEEQRSVRRLMCICVSRARSPELTLDL
jgi:ferredoxin